MYCIKMPLTLSASASLSFKPSVAKPAVVAVKPAVVKPAAKAYVSNGYVMNNNGYLANPSRSSQIAANNAGALTRSEAASMGLPLSGRR